MLIPAYKKQFNKDLKLIAKRCKSFKKFKTVMDLLIQEKQLAKKHRDHPLKGQYSDCCECHIEPSHIEPNWLLIYLIQNNVITFIRTGSHSDLFK